MSENEKKDWLTNLFELKECCQQTAVTWLAGYEAPKYKHNNNLSHELGLDLFKESESLSRRLNQGNRNYNWCIEVDNKMYPGNALNYVEAYLKHGFKDEPYLHPAVLEKAKEVIKRKHSQHEDLSNFPCLLNKAGFDDEVTTVVKRISDKTNKMYSTNLDIAVDIWLQINNKFNTPNNQNYEVSDYIKEKLKNLKESGRLDSDAKCKKIKAVLTPDIAPTGARKTT